MNPVSILLLGLAMSTDAFAAALGKGAGMHKPRWPEAMRIGLLFGVIEGATPLVGWLLGAAASGYIKAWDHWVAFGLLAILGVHMILKAAKAEEDTPLPVRKTGLGATAITALATSIDAMTVGVGLAFVEVNILVVALVIGICTGTLVTVGIMAGRALGAAIGKRAEMIGGLVLIAVGGTILYEHLSGAA